MSKIFTKEGKLKFPEDFSLGLPSEKYRIDEEKVVIYNAFCQNGHDLISSIEVNKHKGLNLIYKKKGHSEKTELVISAIVGDNTKKILYGEDFKNGEEVQVFCPECKEELPILVNCACNAPIYIFYMDKEQQKNFAQSFCSRIDCSQSSKIRFSKEILEEFLVEHSF